MANPQRIVFTGGPGAGKTSVLQALRLRGHAVVDESARVVIQERLSRGLSPRPPPLEFAEEVLRRDIDKYRQSEGERGLVFFDRSILDALGMLDQAAPLRDDELQAQVASHPYHRQVFFFPPWEAIYATDSERDQSLAEAVDVFERLMRWYRRCGHEIVEVPRTPVAERCAYVLDVLGSDT
jgi:predicted ATPase